MDATGRRSVLEKPELKILSKRCAVMVKKNDKKGFDAFEQEYIASPDADENGRQLLVSYRALLDLESLASDSSLAERFRPGMWWMRGPYPGNFGDVLTPYVVWHAFGVAPRWTGPKNADGIAIGSIAKFARSGTKVWGSGMPRETDTLAADAIWSAVRGPLSREAILKAGGTVPEIYGDPAVLLPEIYNPEVEKTADIGIIPHVLQEERIRRNLERSPGSDRVKLISLRAGRFDQIEDVIRQIKSCREIVSTSLHGVIVAHAYGIPCQSARVVGEEEVGDSFKMRDYKLSVGLNDHPIGIPREFEDLEWLEQRVCSLPPRPIDTALLRSAFPFPVNK